MAHIALAWELGGGFGHLHRLRVLAEGLVEAGHRVTLISRYLEQAAKLFSGLPVECVQAPFLPYTIPNACHQTPAYAHILHNAGYGHPPSLDKLLRQWYRLLSGLSPDIVIADHAPSALLVSRSLKVVRISFGDGFTCPPPSAPLPLFSDNLPLLQLLEEERQLVDNCNTVLAAIGLEGIGSLGDIYQVDETLLLTYPELDHFGVRPQVHYYGPLIKPSAGVVPRWPEMGGCRVFAYLKNNEELEAQLLALGSSDLSCVVYGESFPDSLLGLFQEHRFMRFYSQPVNIHAVIEQADLVISHGGHQLTAELMLAGVPQLHWPLTLEQQLTSACLRNMGLAEVDDQSYLSSIDRVASNLGMLGERFSLAGDHLRKHHREWQKRRLLSVVNFWADGC